MSRTTLGLPQGLKRHDREANHSIPSEVEIQNKWSLRATWNDACLCKRKSSAFKNGDKLRRHDSAPFAFSMLCREVKQKLQVSFTPSIKKYVYTFTCFTVPDTRLSMQINLLIFYEYHFEDRAKIHVRARNTEMAVGIFPNLLKRNIYYYFIFRSDHAVSVTGILTIQGFECCSIFKPVYVSTNKLTRVCKQEDHYRHNHRRENLRSQHRKYG